MPSELHDLLDRAADRPSTEPDFDALARVGRRRRYTQRAASALAVVTVIALTSTVVLPRLRPPAVAFDTAPRVGVGTWEAVPASPLGARIDATALADGDRVVVYGGITEDNEGQVQGEIPRYDGAVYDLQARTWKRFPAPPLNFGEEDFVPTAQLLDDGRLLVVNGRMAAAIYDFGSDSWQTTGTAPLADRGEAVLEWTGDRLIVWGGWHEAGEYGDGAVWHPDAGWTKMARSPLRPRTGAASVWTGRRLLIWGGAAGDVAAGEQRVFDDGAAYDPVADTWTPMAAAPLTGRQEPVSSWTGKDWVVIGGFGAERLVQTSPEQDVEPTMTEHCEGGSCTAEASASVTLESYPESEEFVDGARYDPKADTWTPTALPPKQFRNRGIGTVGERIVTGTEAAEATYELASDSWSVVARPGTNPMWDTYDVGGTTVVLNSGENLGMNDQDRPRRLGGVVYNRQAERWDTLSEADTAQRSSPAVAVAGNKVFVWGGLSVTRDMDGYEGEPGAWRRHDDGAVLTLD